MSRSEGAFSAQLVSSRYTGTRPACARQTRATTSRPPMRTLTLSHSPLGGAQRLDRQVARIALAVLGVLHAVVVDRLREVALLVEQTHGDEAGALIARRLAVVGGQHAEAAGVDREALVKAVLGAEVGDERLISRRARACT